MYTPDTDFSISPRTAIYLSIPLGNNLNNLNNLNIPPSPHPVSPFSLSPSSLSPSSGYSPVSPISPISPFSPATSPEMSEGEEFPMYRLDDIKDQLNMFPPPITAMQFIEKNSFEGADGRIKRPSNNFILFRKIAHDQKNQTQALSHYNEREWSQIIGKIWRSLSPDEVYTYKSLGEDVASIHKKLYPDYKYQPKRDKAAWKHYTIQNVTKQSKSKGKGGKVKQQKQQKQERQERQEKQLEIITDFQQPQQLLPSNTLSYNLPPETQVVSNVSTTEISTEISTDGFSFEYSDPVFSNDNLNNFIYSQLWI